MKFAFIHKTVRGEFVTNFITEKVYVDGKEVKKKGKEWITEEGSHIVSKADKLFFRKLVIDGEEVTLIHLRNWEWVFVFLPCLVCFMLGALPVLIGLLGVYFNLWVMMKRELHPALKIVSCIGTLVVAIVLVLGIGIALQ